MSNELVVIPKMGRPTTYSKELTDLICNRLASGESLRAICKEELMPSQTTVFSWLYKYKDFAENYVHARATWADAEFENMMHIADTPHEGVKTKITDDGTETVIGDMIEHRRLQVDTRKWALARMEPKKYGNNKHIDINNSGTIVHLTGDLSSTLSFIGGNGSEGQQGSGGNISQSVPDRPVLAPEVRPEPPVCPE